jgi:hypothetical protein
LLQEKIDFSHPNSKLPNHFSPGTNKETAPRADILIMPQTMFSHRVEAELLPIVDYYTLNVPHHDFLHIPSSGVKTS